MKTFDRTQGIAFACSVMGLGAAVLLPKVLTMPLLAARYPDAAAVFPGNAEIALLVAGVLLVLAGGAAWWPTTEIAPHQMRNRRIAAGVLIVVSVTLVLTSGRMAYVVGDDGITRGGTTTPWADITAFAIGLREVESKGTRYSGSETHTVPYAEIVTATGRTNVWTGLYVDMTDAVLAACTAAKAHGITPSVDVQSGWRYGERLRDAVRAQVDRVLQGEECN